MQVVTCLSENLFYSKTLFDLLLKIYSHRGSKALRLLDCGEFPGGVQPVCSEWHPLQPREPPERSVQVPMGGEHLAPLRDVGGVCVCVCVRARACMGKHMRAWALHMCRADWGRFTSGFNDVSVRSGR